MIIDKILEVLAIIKPLIPLIGRWFPRLQNLISELEHGIETEGAEFINRNIKCFNVLADVAAIGQDVFGAVKLFAETMPRYASDNELSGEEMESSGRMIEMIVRRIGGVDEINDKLDSITLL